MTPALLSRRRFSRTDGRRRSGYTILELLVVITGSVAMITLGATTIVAVRRVAGAAQTAAETGTALSRLHRTLREDAAEAVAATADADGLTLTAADGAAIRFEADGADVRRTATGPRTARDRFIVGGAGFVWIAEERPGGWRIAVGYDRAGGTNRSPEGTAVELSAWLPADIRPPGEETE